VSTTTEVNVLEQAARLLGVPVEVGEDQLREAYRRALWRAHPDVGGDADEFGRVLLAFDLLKSTPISERQGVPVRHQAGLQLSWRFSVRPAAAGFAGSAALVVGVLVGPAYGLAIGIALAGALVVVAVWTAAGRLQVSVAARASAQRQSWADKSSNGKGKE
jgi:hypothetical protein